MPICRLCIRDRELCESHIIPKFMYSDLKNRNRQILGITGIGNKGRTLIQDGAKEYLFCEECELHLSKNYEEPFKKFWIDDLPLPDPWIDDRPRCIETNYSQFKLFHLSILFRAGVCSLPMFNNVNLGHHEARLRKMILDIDAGEEYVYPVGGYGVVHHETKRLIRMITQSQKFKIGGRHCYRIMYGGVEWWFCVASDRNPEFDQFSLKQNGQICLSVFPWTEVAAVQKASAALRNASAPIAK